MNLAALLLCVFSTFAMTGLIWLIQVVQYPLMSEVGEGSFVTYEQAHCQRITPVVLPLMTAELFSAAWLLWRPVQGCSVVLTIAFAALLVVWASTFFIQVPVHNQLCVAFNAEQHRWLVQSNWIRTAMWSVRSGLMIWVLAQQLLLRAGARCRLGEPSAIAGTHRQQRRNLPVGAAFGSQCRRSKRLRKSKAERAAEVVNPIGPQLLTGLRCAAAWSGCH